MSQADIINSQMQKASDKLNETSNYINTAMSHLASQDATVAVSLKGIVDSLHETNAVLRLVVHAVESGAAS